MAGAPRKRKKPVTLATALWHVAQAPLVNAFRDLKGVKDEELKPLAEAVGKLEPEKWRRHDYHSALAQTIWRAIEALRCDDHESDDYGPRERFSMSWRAIGATLYGFENDEAADEIDTTKTYNRRRQVVINTAKPGWSKSSHNRSIEEFFERLAAALASLKPIQSAPSIAKAHATANLSYVARVNLHKEFYNQVQAGARVIAFVGLPGMGKTWLADYLTATERPHRCSWITVTNGKPEEADIAAMLVTHKIALPSFPNLTPLQQLSAALASDNAPSMLVLDNLESLAQLKALMPRDVPKSRVIVTAREIGNTRWVDTSIIEVGAFTSDEAVALAQRYTNNVRTADAIVSQMERYPLGVAFVGKLIVELGLSPGELLSPANLNLISEIPLEVGGTLVAAFERLASVLRERFPDAYLMLLLRVHLLYFHHAEYGLADWVLSDLKGDGSLLSGQSRRIHAEHALQRFSVLQRVDSKYQMHLLVRRLFAQITQHDRYVMIRKCIEGLAYYAQSRPKLQEAQQSLYDLSSVVLARMEIDIRQAELGLESEVINHDLANEHPDMYELLMILRNAAPYPRFEMLMEFTPAGEKINPSELNIEDTHGEVYYDDLFWILLDRYLKRQADGSDIVRFIRRMRSFYFRTDEFSVAASAKDIGLANP